MPDKLATCVTVKLANEDDENEESLFELHYYRNDEFAGEETSTVMFLFEDELEEGLLTSTNHPWVQFAKETKSMLYGLELRGRGKSVIPNHDEKTDPSTFEAHKSDLCDIYENKCMEYGMMPWIIVGQGNTADLAIWNRVEEEEIWKCAYAIDVDLSKLVEHDGKSIQEFGPSNIILGAKDDSQFEEYTKFAEKLGGDAKNIVAVRQSDHKKVIELLKKIGYAGEA